VRPWPVVLVTDLVLLGFSVWSVAVQFHYRVPGRLVPLILPWVGVAVTMLSLFSLLNHLLRWVPLDESVRRRFRGLEQALSYVVVGFCLYGTLLFVNGTFSGPETVHTAGLVEISGGEVGLGPFRVFSWATLRSWRRPGQTERLLIPDGERWQLWGGQDVLVHVRPGLFGISWVSQVELNQERVYRAVLEMTPTAARVWAGLAHVYVRSRRFDEARQAGIRYLEIYPRDAPFAMWLGTLLIDASRPADAVAILEPLATRTPSRELHERLGFALALAGRRAEGIPHLRKAIELAPREWWPYWGLAHVYYWGGEFDQAIPLFEKALELRPHHPEARDILARVRTLAAARDRQLKSP
jgi:tetratricopeptide (TPR) repeat protein